VTHAVVEVADDLAYLANQGTITFHVWTSKLPVLEAPDHLVLDLDPSDGDLGKIREVAEVGRAVMRSFGLEPVLVASGSRGFHLWSAIEPDADFAATGRAAWCLAALVAIRAPEIATTEFIKKERGKRVFVDWLRNRWAQSIACPYSVRSRRAPSVATPLRWNELQKAIPAGWDIDSIADRYAQAPPMPTRTPLKVEAVIEAAERAGIDIAHTHDRFRG
jgi:bifunctional non-homologous end joining protein LigD